jgi:hypothetical protein
MTERAFKVGYRKCTAPDCDHPVHYKVNECPSCGAVQVRAPATGKAAAADSPSVGKSQGTTAPQVLTAPAPAVGSDVSASTASGIASPVGAGVGQVDGPYVVMADCRPQLGNVMAVLKKGAVVTDYMTIGALLAAGAPIVPQNQAHGLACCPRCQMIFTATPLAPTRQRQAG